MMLSVCFAHSRHPLGPERATCSQSLSHTCPWMPPPTVSTAGSANALVCTPGSPSGLRGSLNWLGKVPLVCLLREGLLSLPKPEACSAVVLRLSRQVIRPTLRNQDPAS